MDIRNIAIFNREKYFPSELYQQKSIYNDLIIRSKRYGIIRFALPCFVFNPTDEYFCPASTWAFLPCTLFFVSDMGLLAFVHEHFLPSPWCIGIFALRRRPKSQNHTWSWLLCLYDIFASGITLFWLIISTFEGLLTVSGMIFHHF